MIRISKCFRRDLSYIFITLLSLKGKMINLKILRRGFSDILHISEANVILFSD